MKKYKLIFPKKKIQDENIVFIIIVFINFKTISGISLLVP